MKTIIIAAMDRNGVIGRTIKPCDRCGGAGRVLDGHGSNKWCPSCLLHDGLVPANDVPWSYPEIDEHFDRITMGHAVVMGRRTWEARGGRPLEGRTCMTVSSARGCVKSIDNAIALSRAKGLECAYIAGGAKLFTPALPLADELDLTLIDRAFEGDVKFPGGMSHQSVDGSLLGGNTFWTYAGLRFELVSSRQGSTPELTFTRWVRR